MNALVSLQAALAARAVSLHCCELHPEIGVLVNSTTENSLRFTYALVLRGQVQAITMFVKTDPAQGAPFFHVGYAVAESARRQGLGSRILQQGIEELKNGFCRTLMPGFFLEALVSKDNEASNNISLASRTVNVPSVHWAACS